MDMKCTAVVLTGGRGERLGELGYPKQFCAINDKPVFIHSLEIFENMDEVDDIYLVINAEYREKYQEHLEGHPISKLRGMVDGGATRQDSVAHAVAAIESTDIVILHDGANPTTRADFIHDCIEAASQQGACSGCVAPRDTVVQTNHHEIDVVLNRDSLAYTCSPQVYRFDLIQKALAQAKKNNLTGRPTVELVKQISQKVAVVLCPHKTIKITQFEDVYLAEQLLNKQ